ncbi:LLM class flavin-dependent oxidoreductase [Hamadaea tsunoensis]|uniref:LLM class flavin-dependent oxidoreductase n=1 Tax=Hamadaea tsunoensis TaxID=53368 RepID=UPI001FE1924E|nr:LLM class flavin-dependent oxidoreductase [Hamadaea tsunoensis]
MDLIFGSFVTPSAQQPRTVVRLAQLAEQAGLDLVTFQDHPYQPAFLDTWTLMSYVAAVTERITLSANVLNLPLRQPVVIARSAASLDLLSGGRVELGIGAGGFWDAIEAAGGRRLTPGQSVDALAEAITIIREIWAADQRGGVRVDGRYHRATGAKRGPAPAHDMGIWVGAYKPRMLRLIGAAADGWLPSLPYLSGGPADLAEMNKHIDDAAQTAGRDPANIRRLLNIGGQFTQRATGLLAGPPDSWAEDLAGIALDYGISGFIMMGDDPTTIQRYAEEVAPAVRELVAAEQKPAPPTSEPESRPEIVAVTAPPTERLSSRQPWDESDRPTAPAAPEGQVYSDRAKAAGAHLVEVHDHLRAELAQLRDLLQQVRDGAVDVGRARQAVNEMAIRQNNWTLGAYCAAYCGMLTQHHGIEDASIFPHLRRADPGLAPVVDRLEQEHHVIHSIVGEVDRALVNLVGHPDDFGPVQDALDTLTDALLSHLAYEEREITEPLARFGFYSGQL